MKNKSHSVHGALLPPRKGFVVWHDAKSPQEPPPLLALRLQALSVLKSCLLLCWHLMPFRSFVPESRRPPPGTHSAT